MHNTAEKHTPILVVLQAQGEALHPQSAGLAAMALQLGGQRGQAVGGVLLCEQLGQAARAQLAETGLAWARVLESPAFACFIAEQHAAALLDTCQALLPEVVLLGSTPEGRALAPMLAAALGTGVTADCTGVEYTPDGLLLQTRPAFGGELMARILTPEGRPQIATLRGNTQACERDAGPPVEISTLPWKPQNSPKPVKAGWLDRAGHTPMGQQACILALGGGVQRQEDLALFEQAAAQLGAPLFCSRALVERGWLPRQRQIGLSGQSVAPTLLVALGVSGSVQFLAGVGPATRLLAVNSDENAPILRRADVPILGDMYAIANILACKP